MIDGSNKGMYKSVTINIQLFPYLLEKFAILCPSRGLTVTTTDRYISYLLSHVIFSLRFRLFSEYPINIDQAIN